MTKQETLLGKGAQVESSGVREQGGLFCRVPGFIALGLVSRLSLANHSDSGSFLVACSSLSQDGCQREGFWEVGRTCGLMSPLSF